MPELTRKELQQEIFEQASMRAIVESYGIQIQRNNTFICPFHDDTKPSMSIAKSDKYCKCFACGESGNVYTFIEKYEQQVNHRSLSPKEIFKLMAEKSNINVDLTILDKNNSETSISPQQQRRIDLYNSIDYAERLYQYQLGTESGKIAKDYLIKRNINEEIQKQFGIGYASDGLTRQMIDKTPDTTIDKLEAVNIISRDEDGNVREVFRNRIVIPIRDDSGRIVAFGGRIINSNGKASKYLNSKETEIFHKSNILFNYNYARNYATNGEIFVVEGYMDVVGANVLGYKNSVALMGVEMSEQHINKIKRINSSVVLALDNDVSGKKAIIKTIPKLVQNNINVSVLDISKIQNGKYKDFGDLSENNVSKDEIENSRISAFEYYFDNKYFNEKYDVDTIKNAFDSERRIMIRDTKDIIKYQQYIQSRTSFTKEEIQDIINPRKIDVQKENVEVLPPNTNSKMETFKNLLFMNNLYMQIDDFLEKYNDSVLTGYYNSNKNELYNQMLGNITNNPDKYIDETGTALNVALAIREVTENNVDYHRYETINRFGHEKAFDSCYVLNAETQQRERIKLNELQKEMIVKQYDSTIDEQAKIDLKNVEDIYVINNVNDLKRILPNDNLLSIEIKEQMIKQMRELKKMEFFSYSMVFPENQIPYMNKEFLTSDGKNYKSILLVNNFDRSLNIDSKNYVSSNTQPTNENEEKVEVLPSNEKTVEVNKIFTVNKVLLQHENEESIFTRIPNTMGKKYMYLDKERYTQIDEETGKYVMNSNEEIPIYDKVGNFTEKLSVDEVMRYWADKTKQMSKENKPKEHNQQEVISKNEDYQNISNDSKEATNRNVEVLPSNNANDNRLKVNNIIIPKYAIEVETKKGVYIATKTDNQYLYVSKDAILKNEENKIYINADAKERMNIYQKNREGKMKIMYGSVSKKTLKDVITDKGVKSMWKYFHLDMRALRTNGEFIQIPLQVGNEKGYVYVNQRFVDRNGTLKCRNDFNYKFHNENTTKTISLNELQKGFKEYLKYQIQKNRELEMVADGKGR